MIDNRKTRARRGALGVAGAAAAILLLGACGDDEARVTLDGPVSPATGEPVARQVTHKIRQLRG